MKIKGIPCTLKSPVAVRLVKKFLAEIAKNHPKDFQKIQSKTTLIKRVPKKEIDLGTMGQVVEVDAEVSSEAFFAGAFDDNQVEDVFKKVIVFIDETVKDSESMFVTIAHEFGHVCTTEKDLARRNAPSNEWASEATADWYVYKWGFGSISRKMNVKYPRRLSHHGAMPGETLTDNGITYRLSRNFVYRNISEPFKSLAAKLKDRCLEFMSKSGMHI